MSDLRKFKPEGLSTKIEVFRQSDGEIKSRRSMARALLLCKGRDMR